MSWQHSPHRRGALLVLSLRQSYLHQNQQELSVLSLHLLQICLVYVNTLMIQSVLGDRAGSDELAPEDLRALSPLIYNHVNPDGIFELDMEQRIRIAA